MKKENGRDPRQDSFSLFKSNIANKGLSWAVQIRQKLENVNLDDIAVKASSRYVDAFGEQFKKMCAEVDDWLKPSSDGVTPQIPCPTKIHEPTAKVQIIMSSEPKFSVLEPISYEIEPVTNVVQETGNAPEVLKIDVSSERDDCNLAGPMLPAQRAWIDELLNSSTNPFEHENADTKCQVSKIAEEEHLFNVKQAFDEGGLDEEFDVNSAPKGDPKTEEIIGNLTSVTSETSVCYEENRVDEISKVHGCSLSVDACRCSCIEELLPSSNEIDINANVFSANFMPEILEIINDISDLSVDADRHPCIGEVHGTSLGNLISSSNTCGNCDGGDASGPVSQGACNSHVAALITEVHGSLCERCIAFERRDCSASSAAKDGVSDFGCVSLSDKEVHDLLSTKLELFEDVELGDCWDDLDHEEVHILSQRRKTNTSYKKKIKKTLRSISWSSKNKASSQTANPQNNGKCDICCSIPACKNTSMGELAKDACDSDWELI